ncbi:MAG: shikimate kinase [Deinococcota bacterium]
MPRPTEVVDLAQRVEAALAATLLTPDMPERAGPERELFTLMDWVSSKLSPMNGSGLIERPVTWVALAGFMGTGKSRIGWELSRVLALHFVDTDKLITRVVGKSIPEVFAQEGEAYFRACEAEVVRRVTRLDHAVVSLGGGTFIHEANRRKLLERGPVVVLWASPETVYQRTRHSDRPLLQSADPLSRIRTLMIEREEHYRQGTIHVHSDGRPAEEIVEEVIERLWEWADSQMEIEPVAERASD